MQTKDVVVQKKQISESNDKEKKSCTANEKLKNVETIGKSTKQTIPKNSQEQKIIKKKEKEFGTNYLRCGY